MAVTESVSDAPMPAAEQAAAHDLLAAERATAALRIEALSRDFTGIVESSVASDDEHDPEGSTIAFERAQVAALLSQARNDLDELDEALERLRVGAYGRCESCGRSIAGERLAARPAARTCIGCAQTGRR